MVQLVRKILSMAFALWVIVTLSFVFLYRLPGDPARMILGPHASSEAVAAFRSEASLDQPLVVQYARYVGRLIHLDLGESFALRRSVGELLRERGWTTLKLAFGATAFIAVCGFGLPLCLKLLRWEGLLRVCDRTLAVLALAPPYVLAIAGLLVGAGWLGWISVVFDPSRFTAWLLPAAALGAYPAALVLRLFAGRLKEELAAPYACRARALGLSLPHVVLREVVPNALPAALAALANSLAYFATGAFFVEAVFGIPGLGRLAQEALRNKDMAVLAGLCLVFAIVVLLLSATLNALQRWLDPRVNRAEDHA